MMMKNKKNVPDIRFKRFAEEWENEPLGELATFSKGRGYSKGDIVEVGTPIVLYGRLYTKYQTIISDVDTFATQKKDSILSKGTEVVVPASGETAEDISRASVIIRPNVIIAGDLNIIYPNSDLDSVFLALSISNGDAQKNLSKKAQGKSVVHLHNSDLDGIELNHPKIREQRAIGNYFQNIDRLINTSQTKLDKLKNIKKACLEKMFPKNGSNTPKLRFKGFTDEWKEKELKDIVDVRSGRDYKHLSDGNIPVYGTGGYMLSVNNALSYHENAVGIGRKGTIDKPYILYAPFWTVDTLFYAVPRKNNDLNFVYDLFQQVDWRKKDESTGVPSLSKVAINSIAVNTTAYREQQAIGDFLKNIDDIIAKTEQQINKLKNIKKACLDKMFVNTEDAI